MAGMTWRVSQASCNGDISRASLQRGKSSRSAISLVINKLAPGGHRPPLQQMMIYPRLERLDQLFFSNPVHFITFCTKDRKRILDNQEIHQSFVEFSVEAYALTINEQLTSAVEQGDTATVLKLLSNGADINGRDARGRTPVMAATHGNRVATVQALIQAGADINLRDNMLDNPSRHRESIASLFMELPNQTLEFTPCGRSETRKKTLISSAHLRGVNVHDPKYCQFTATNEPTNNAFLPLHRDSSLDLGSK